VRQIAASRSSSHALLIHVEKELIVRADVHNKALWWLLQFEHFAKVEYERVALGSIRTSDPLRGLGFVQKIRSNLGPQKSTVYEEHHGCNREENCSLIAHLVPQSSSDYNLSGTEIVPSLDFSQGLLRSG